MEGSTWLLHVGSTLNLGAAEVRTCKTPERDSSMPFTYRIDTEHQVVYGHIWGVWSFEDVREFRERAVADPDYHVGIRQLFDFTEAAGFEMTVKEMVLMGASLPAEMTGRRAYVVPDPANFGMLRAY